jgi:uncharacterized membrane protein
MATTHPHAPPSPELTGTALVWLLSLSGGLLSAFLTVAKFRSAFRCDESLVSACGSVFECGRVLTSVRSQLFGVPISVFSFSYYAVLFGLATAILVRPARNLGLVGPLLSWAVVVGAALTGYLAAHAHFHLRSTCGYCLGVYAIQLVLLLAVWLMHPGGLFASLVAVWSRLRARGGFALIAGLGFVALSTTQMVIYRNGSATMSIEPRCVVQGRSLPDTVLRTADVPGVPVEAEIGLFVDLACPSCRDEFTSWVQDARASGGRYRLSVYHYAREGNCVPGNFTALSPDANANHSCDAAVAVECVARHAPAGVSAATAGLDMMQLVFALQSQRTPHFERERLTAAARQLHVDEAAFLACLDDRQVLERIVDHARFGLAQHLRETPGTFFLLHEDGVPSDQMLLFRGAKTYGDVDAMIDHLRRQLRERQG